MNGLHEAIESQRARLRAWLAAPMAALGSRCAGSWNEPERLDDILREALAAVPACRRLYAIDTRGVQISSSVGQHGLDRGARGQRHASRRFLRGTLPEGDLVLSEVYICREERRSGITASRIVSDASSLLGFVAADFHLRDISVSTQHAASMQTGWRQIVGDPAIRGAVFGQQRARSTMDERIDDVITIMDELIRERGVFHAKLHFSSSRATLWLTDDPYRYRVHVLEEITDPSVCLAFPACAYPWRTAVPPALVRPVLERFKRLREADDNIYLRSGSLNVISGMVGLNFSCDGSHYMPAEEFFDKDERFWFGSIAAGA